MTDKEVPNLVDHDGLFNKTYEQLRSFVERSILYDGCDYWHLTPNGKYYNYGPDITKPDNWTTFEELKHMCDVDGEVLQRMTPKHGWQPL